MESVSRTRCLHCQIQFSFKIFDANHAFQLSTPTSPNGLATDACRGDTEMSSMADCCAVSGPPIMTWSVTMLPSPTVPTASRP